MFSKHAGRLTFWIYELAPLLFWIALILNHPRCCFPNFKYGWEDRSLTKYSHQLQMIFRIVFSNRGKKFWIATRLFIPAISNKHLAGICDRKFSVFKGLNWRAVVLPVSRYFAKGQPASLHWLSARRASMAHSGYRRNQPLFESDPARQCTPRGAFARYGHQMVMEFLVKWSSQTGGFGSNRGLFVNVHLTE
jgi:hypothetical protein